MSFISILLGATKKSSVLASPRVISLLYFNPLSLRDIPLSGGICCLAATSILLGATKKSIAGAVLFLQLQKNKLTLDFKQIW